MNTKLYEQFAESARLEAAIRASLEGWGYGSQKCEGGRVKKGEMGER